MTEMELYQTWLDLANDDPDLHQELQEIQKPLTIASIGIWNLEPAVCVVYLVPEPIE